MNISSPFPTDVDALIDALDTIYPDRVPALTDSEKEVWAKVGQVSVVSFLKAWRKASLEKHPSDIATTAGRSTNQAVRTRGSARHRAGRRSTPPEKGGR